MHLKVVTDQCSHARQFCVWFIAYSTSVIDRHKWASSQRRCCEGDGEFTLTQVHVRSQRETPGSEESRQRRSVDSEIVCSGLRKDAVEMESLPKGERERTVWRALHVLTSQSVWVVRACGTQKPGPAEDARGEPSDVGTGIRTGSLCFNWRERKEQQSLAPLCLTEPGAVNVVWCPHLPSEAAEARSWAGETWAGAGPRVIEPVFIIWSLQFTRCSRAMDKTTW